MKLKVIVMSIEDAYGPKAKKPEGVIAVLTDYKWRVVRYIVEAEDGVELPVETI